MALIGRTLVDRGVNGLGVANMVTSRRSFESTEYIV